jgi:hypothetical protein
MLCSLPACAQFEPVHQGPPAPKYAGPVLVTMFQGKLDTENAKVGDEVTLKVKHPLKIKDLKIPSGSTVVGKIVSVQSKQQGDGTAALGLQFEKIQMKGGKEMPIRGLIVAIGRVSLSSGPGYVGIMSRDGAGSTPGLDPSLAAGHGPVDDVPPGSSLPGVALAEGLDKEQATQMRGIKTDIKLDPTTMVKIELFRAAPAS